MAAQSLDSLLNWMRNPNNNMMWGWDCIAAIARIKANRLLLQEYIARFTGSSYLDPISGEVESIAGQWKEFIHDFILDAPQLSFDTAALDGSKAALSCSILSGTQLSMSHDVDHWQIMKVVEVDALQGPTLFLDLNLADVPGNVDADGGVLLDLARSDNFRLTYAPAVDAQKLGGDFFKDLFNRLDAKDRVWVLGRIEGGAQDGLRPQAFRLRTQASDPAGAGDDGAVLVLISMTGSVPGGIVPSDYPYLIPNDPGMDYSATVLFEPMQVATHVLLERIPDIVNSRDFTYQYGSSGKVSSVTVRNGEYILPEGEYDIPLYPTLPGHNETVHLHLDKITLPTNSSDPFTLIVREGGLSISWETSAPLMGKVVSANSNDVIVLDNRLNLHLLVNYELREVSGRAALVRTVCEVMPSIGNSQSDSFQGGNVNDVISELVKLIVYAFLTSVWVATAVGATVLSKVGLAFLMDFSMSNALSRFLDGHIKLNFAQAIEGDTIRVPRDIGFFGRVNPSRSSFLVDPIQPLVAADGNLQFTTSPPTDGLTWTLSKLPGETRNAGLLTAAGRYQAPAVSALDGRFLRLRITATHAASGYHSSALVTVLPNQLSVNPVIQVCNYAQSVELMAGALSNGRLRWAIKNPVSGESGQMVPNPQPEGACYRYVAGPGVTSKSYVLDQIEVNHVASGKQCSAWVLVIQPKAPLVVVTPVLPLASPNQVQLTASINGNPITAEWKLPMAGPGSIDNQGLYRVDATAAAGFVLIFAVVNSEDFGTFEGHIILPLPLSGFPNELALMKA